MILFLKDYDKYPNAIIDTETHNRSFVRICSLYREMGIRNHLFPLVLMDKSLQGVNPFDHTLTLDTQMRIALECKLNPFYFFREVVRVPAQAGVDPTPLEANRGNIAIFWSFFNHITTILIQPRQTGKSLSVDCLNEYLLNIRCLNTEINLLTKDDTLRAANIRRIKDIDAELPSYLKRRTKHDINNSEEITYKALGNRYRGHLPQKSPKMAYNVGRGLSSPIFQIDEGPFQSNIGISLPAALAAGTAMREKAALNNEPYGTILTTTAGKKDDRDGKFMFNFMSEAATWTEKFFDCENIEELESTVRKNSRTGKLRINATFSHKQLGKTDEWLKRAIEDTGATGEDADRDYFNVWTSGNMYSPLPVSTLETIRASQRTETHTSIAHIGSYLTRWFVDENIKESILSQDQLVMALDTSDASGGDDISMLLNRVSDFETIAAGTYNETNLIKFAEWLCDWLVKYPNITMIIERKSSGVAIIDYLLLMLPTKGIDPFRRLFNRVVNDSLPNSDIMREISVPVGRKPHEIYTRYKKTFGFATSGTGITSRSELYSTTLQNAAKLVGDRIRDTTTINQITALVNINGRVDHPQGEHDDMVISWILGFWLLTKGTNLSFYGIESSQILSEINASKIVSKKEYVDYIEQQEVRREIERVYEQLQNESDYYVITLLETELKNLNRRLVLEEGEKFSVDELIESLREEKKRNRQSQRSNDYNYYDDTHILAIPHRDPRRGF